MTGLLIGALTASSGCISLLAHRHLLRALCWLACRGDQDKMSEATSGWPIATCYARSAGSLAVVIKTRRAKQRAARSKARLVQGCCSRRRRSGSVEGSFDASRSAIAGPHSRCG